MKQIWFKVEGFTLAIELFEGKVISMLYVPETPLNKTQMMDVLQKNSPTAWKKESETEDKMKLATS